MIHYCVPSDTGPLSTPFKGNVKEFLETVGDEVGKSGKRWKNACGKKWVTEASVQAGVVESGTGEAWLVTCPECQKTPEWQEAMKAWFEVTDFETMIPSMKVAALTWKAQQES